MKINRLLKFFFIASVGSAILLLLMWSANNQIAERGRALANSSLHSAAMTVSVMNGKLTNESNSNALVEDSAMISDSVAANVDQQAQLHELIQLIGPGNGDRDQTANPYLLSDYAQQCKAYMGTVPEFSCTTLIQSTMITRAVVAVDKARGKCPLITGVDKKCDINTTVEGSLKAQPDAPSPADVTILFSCRVYDHTNKAGRYDDIAVIQHDKRTGNTCWFNSPTVPELDVKGNVQYDTNDINDTDRNVIYKDFDGTLIPSPMSPGAESFWLHPYHPDDAFTLPTDGAIFLNDLRQGKRGIIADKNCQRCHDADPFVWTPYLDAVHVITDTQSPVGWNDEGNYVSNFLGIFDADGISRHTPLRFKPNDPDATKPFGDCADCHQLGEFTMQPTTVTVNSKPVVNLLDIIFTDTQRNLAWMPPPSASQHPNLTLEIRNRIRGCAINPLALGCNGKLPGPAKRAGLTVTTRTSPDTLIGGQEVRYTISLANSKGPYTDTVKDLKVEDSLPPGVTFVSGSTGCAASAASPSIVECTPPAIAYGESVTLTVIGKLRGDGARTVVNTVTVKSTAVIFSPEEINISSIQVQNVNRALRDVDLVLSEESTLLPVPDDNPTEYKLRIKLTVLNRGPAVAANVLLTHTLPAGAIYDADLSSFECGESVGIVTCLLGELADARISSVAIHARVPVDSGPFYTHSAEVVAIAQNDRNPTDNALSSVAIPSGIGGAASEQVYLPVIMRPAQRGIDLVVKSISLSADDAQVVIQNIGDTALLPGDSFWVDLYINPNPPPTDVNEFPDTQKGLGLVWGVLAPDFGLAVGQETTLRIGDLFYSKTRSRFPETLQAGSKIYVQVDSINIDSDYGGVLEEHEVGKGAYNNISSITLAESVSTVQWRTK